MRSIPNKNSGEVQMPGAAQGISSVWFWRGYLDCRKSAQTANCHSEKSREPSAIVLWGHFLLDKGESTREKTFGWVFATKRPLIFFWCKILNPFLHTEISLRFCGPVCPKYTKPFSNPTPSGDGSRFHWLPDTQRSARIQQKVGLCFTPSILFLAKKLWEFLSDPNNSPLWRKCY